MPSSHLPHAPQYGLPAFKTREQVTRAGFQFPMCPLACLVTCWELESGLGGLLSSSQVKVDRQDVNQHELCNRQVRWATGSVKIFSQNHAPLASTGMKCLQCVILWATTPSPRSNSSLPTASCWSLSSSQASLLSNYSGSHFSSTS